MHLGMSRNEAIEGSESRKTEGQRLTSVVGAVGQSFPLLARGLINSMTQVSQWFGSGMAGRLTLHVEAVHGEQFLT